MNENAGDKKQILCFGDSNTWGLVPGSEPFERYPQSIRWTGVLQEKYPEITVLEEGLCGRTTVFEDALRPGRNGKEALPVILESHMPIYAAVLMLGTNDCKSLYANNEYTIGRGIELVLDELQKYVIPERILLVSPILLGSNVWMPHKDPEFDQRSVEVCRKLKYVYSNIARKRKTIFLAADEYVTASSTDDEHMDAEGHRLFADAIYSKLKEMEIFLK